MSSWLLEGMAGGPAQRDYAGVDVRSASLSALGCVPQFPPPSQLETLTPPGLFAVFLLMGK